MYFTHFKFNAPSGLNHGSRYSGYIINSKNYSKIYKPGIYVENSPRWGQMALSSYPVNINATNYVAELLAELGYRLSMNYGSDRSGAKVSGDVLRQYGVTWDESDYDITKVFRDIEKGLPVLIRAYSREWTTGWWLWKKTRYGYGHAWLIDGVSENTTQYESTYLWELVTIKGDKLRQTTPNNRFSSDNYDNNGPTTVNDLYRTYEEVLDLPTAARKHKEVGLIESETHQYTNRSYLMNWGWGGYEDETEYAPNANVWTAGGINFQFERKIFYNVRKIN